MRSDFARRVGRLEQVRPPGGRWTVPPCALPDDRGRIRPVWEPGTGPRYGRHALPDRDPRYEDPGGPDDAAGGPDQ